MNKIIAIYPGRFQPFSKHHAAAFMWLQQQFGTENCWIVTSDYTDSKSPLSFEDKTSIINLYGINNIINSKEPYNVKYVIDHLNLDVDNTSIVVMLGEKDKNRISTKPKKDGSPSYYKNLNLDDDMSKLRSISECGYIFVMPHISININNEELNGTYVRKILGDESIPEESRIKYFKDFFGWYDVNMFNYLSSKFNNLNEMKLHPVVNLIKNYKGGDLDLEDYDNIDFGKIIPENFHVTGDLILWLNKVITTLPEGLKVDGSLLLFQCTNFTTLPKNLTIGGHLDMSECFNFTTLPDDLIVKKNLYLTSCKKLTDIPKTIKVGGRIYPPTPGVNLIPDINEMKLHPAVNLIKNYKGDENIELPIHLDYKLKNNLFEAKIKLLNIDKKDERNSKILYDEIIKAKLEHLDVALEYERSYRYDEDDNIKYSINDKIHINIMVTHKQTGDTIKIYNLDDLEHLRFKYNDKSSLHDNNWTDVNYVINKLTNFCYKTNYSNDLIDGVYDRNNKKRYNNVKDFFDAVKKDSSILASLKYVDINDNNQIKSFQKIETYIDFFSDEPVDYSVLAIHDLTDFEIIITDKYNQYSIIKTLNSKSTVFDQKILLTTSNDTAYNKLSNLIRQKIGKHAIIHKFDYDIDYFNRDRYMELNEMKLHPAVNLIKNYKGGDLDLKKYDSIDFSKIIPENFQVTGNLDLRNNKVITTLPKGLTVDGGLYLYECENLTHLPSELHVTGTVGLSMCPKLITIPKDITILGNLELFQCTSLKSLPNNLIVGGNLMILECTNLTSLPKNLTVMGNIYMDDALISSIKPDLNVKGRIYESNINETTFSKEYWSKQFINEELDFNKLFPKWYDNVTDIPEALIAIMHNTDNTHQYTYDDVVGEYKYKGITSKIRTIWSIVLGYIIRTNSYRDYEYMQFQNNAYQYILKHNPSIKNIPIDKVYSSNRMSIFDIIHGVLSGIPPKDINTFINTNPNDRKIQSNTKYLTEMKLHPAISLVTNYKGGDLDLSKFPNINWGEIIPENFHVTGDLSIAKNKLITTLPKGLKVDMDLYLYNCENLTSLPEGLTLGRNLIVNWCYNLTHLPKNLILSGDVDMNDCIKLTSLPEGLNVKGYLDLDGCYQLRSLPNGLTVGRYLDLSNCLSLKSLPDDLKVGSSIMLPDHLRRKVNLTEMKLHPAINLIKNYKGDDLDLEKYDNVDWGLIIPENFHVIGSLDFTFNSAITTLPKNLTVDGSLFLYKCVNLTSLPEGLKVGENLKLNWCFNLKSLPDDLTVEKDLILRGCSSLTEIPKTIKVGGNIILPEHLKNNINETTFSKEYWTKQLVHEQSTEYKKHIPHIFELPTINSGRNLIDAFNITSKFLQQNKASVKIDGVNASIRLANINNVKQFVIDRKSNKPLDVQGVTINDLETRFGKGHGFIERGKTVLEIFNKSLPYITSELKQLGFWDNSNLMFNLEYVSGKTNVQEYNDNFIVIHGILEMYQVTANRRASKDISFNKVILEQLIGKISDIAKSFNFKIVHEFKTDVISPINYNGILKSSVEFISNNKVIKHDIKSWLEKMRVLPKHINVVFKDSNKKHEAISKYVLTTVMNNNNLDELADKQYHNDIIFGYLTYYITMKLGDVILQSLSSELGPLSTQEGIVIKGSPLGSIFKITGDFIIRGMSSEFRK